MQRRRERLERKELGDWTESRTKNAPYSGMKPKVTSQRKYVRMYDKVVEKEQKI
jgi:hypothetical protein